MSYRLAKALETLRAQVNTAWPSRSKISDGWIGDARHCGRPNPSSDHCPRGGVVLALDITHDPAHGLDAGKLAEDLRQSADKRLAYIISNGRIWNPSISPAWRKYTGANAHTQHCHISLKRSPASLYDDTRPWAIDGVVTAPETKVPVVVPQGAPLLKKGSKGPAVVRLQTLLNRHGARPELLADGIFGAKTLVAVRAFQKAKGLLVDGKVGSKETWPALEAITATTTAAEQPDDMRVMSAGADFDRVVKHYEGRADRIYGIGGLLHGGYGHQLGDHEGWKAGDAVSASQIEAWFLSDKVIAEQRLLKHVVVRLDQKQFDAVASIIWNGGDWDDPTDRGDSPLHYRTPHGILANLLNEGDMDRAAKIVAALGDKPARDGKVYRGIVNRRLTEAELFRGEPYQLR